MIRFLIDENLSPRLVDVANARGYVAYRVAHRGWGSAMDAEIARRCREERLTIVTDDRIDFEPIRRRAALPPGIVVIVPNVRREAQRAPLRPGGRSDRAGGPA